MDTDHEVLIRLDLQSVFTRLEQSRGSVSNWNIASIVFGGLLWLWLQAPSFNILPAAIRSVLIVVGFLGYGGFGAANSSVYNAADYINLGYGIIVGPLFLFFVALGWLKAERRLAALQKAIAAHPALAGFPPTQRSPSSRRVAAYCLAVVALVGSTVAAINRFFSLQAYEGDLWCAREVEPACLHENYWAPPWPSAQRSKLSWLRLHVSDDWCVAPAPGWPPGFRSVVRDGYFTDQIANLPKFKCSPGDIKPHLEKASTGISKLLEQLGPDSDQGAVRSLLESLSATNPYRRFPYVYPLINIPLLLIFGIAQITVLYLIANTRWFQISLWSNLKNTFTRKAR